MKTKEEIRKRRKEVDGVIEVLDKAIQDKEVLEENNTLEKTVRYAYCAEYDRLSKMLFNNIIGEEE